MESNEKMLELIGKLVSQFLADNGGYANQYRSCVIGKITPNKLGGITELVTPTTYSLSKHKINTLCNELEKKIKKLLALYNFEKEIILENKSNDDGVYIQRISITDSKIIFIPNSQPLVIKNQQLI